MDDIIRLIIFFLILYSIFGSFFGKKKNEQRTQKQFPQGGREEAKQKTSSQPQYSATDLLQDLFGVKLPKTGDEYGLPQRTNQHTDLEYKLPEWSKQTEIETRNIPDINYDKLPSLEVQQNLSVPVEKTITYEPVMLFNKRTIELKKKIKNPATLKDLYLISEILNKPKARRR